MATHTYFDFTLRTSFPKAGMHTLQKENFLIGDFVILSVNYFNIKSIYNKN